MAYKTLGRYAPRKVKKKKTFLEIKVGVDFSVRQALYGKAYC